jgi:hypothetical protein
MLIFDPNLMLLEYSQKYFCLLSILIYRTIANYLKSIDTKRQKIQIKVLIIQTKLVFRVSIL